MSGKQISLIYFYIISAASLALIVIGIFNSVNFIVNVTQYSKYPLRYFGEGNCEVYPYRGPAAVDVPVNMASPSASEQAENKKKCEEQVELLRKQHQIEDLRNSITFTLVGVALFAIHFPLARKHSN